MPTTDIIGYLWRQRQELDLDGLPDVLSMVADLQRAGLECARIEDVRVLGVPMHASVVLIRHEPEEWERLVHDTIANAAVANTIHMTHEDGDWA